jgi:sporulation protein YlmC with PRC-barrel domain
MLVGSDLLDRQIVDCDGLLVGKVDDVELEDADLEDADLEDGELTDGGPPRVVALLFGPGALGQRIGGRFGRAIAGLARRLHPDPDPASVRIPYEVVAHLDSAVHLGIPRGELPRPWLEGWLCDCVIARIPGAGRAGE